VVGCVPPGPDAGPVTDMTCIIDDMMNPSTETGGYWYTYSDRTLPNSTILVPNPIGTISPLEGAEFPPDLTTGTGPTVPGVGVAPFRRFSGGGLNLWGAGTGFDWTDSVPPMTDDAGDGAAALGVPVAYNASAHKGISFYGITNTGTSQSVGIHFSDKREAAAGGICNVDAAFVVFDGGADTVTNASECSDDFVKTVTFMPTWQNFTVKFSATAQGFMDGMPLTALDPTSLYQVHFQINNPGYGAKGAGPIAPEPPWDISVAYITFYDGP
jgi:hypothetical protein